MVLAESRRLPADDPTLSGWLGKLPAPVTVALEATVYWVWLYDRLTAAGFGAVGAHPRRMKLIWHARAKTDPIDAWKLAELARTHVLPANQGACSQHAFGRRRGTLPPLHPTSEVP